MQLIHLKVKVSEWNRIFCIKGDPSKDASLPENAQNVQLYIHFSINLNVSCHSTIKYIYIYMLQFFFLISNMSSSGHRESVNQKQKRIGSWCKVVTHAVRMTSQTWSQWQSSNNQLPCLTLLNIVLHQLLVYLLLLLFLISLLTPNKDSLLKALVFNCCLCVVIQVSTFL